MGINKERPHLHLLPEDDQDADLAKGFLLHLKENWRTVPVMVLPPPGGWLKALEYFRDNLIADMRRCKGRRTVIVIDFDEDDDRRRKAQSFIPDDVADRVFVVGSWKEPKDLKKAFGLNCEAIGRKIAGECVAGECVNYTGNSWEHPLLDHNAGEVRRLGPLVRELVS